MNQLGSLAAVCALDTVLMPRLGSTAVIGLMALLAKNVSSTRIIVASSVTITAQ
jgi:hypothetical protein